MALNKREKTLAMVVAALGAAVLAYLLLFSGPSGSLASLQQQYDVVADKVTKAEERRDALRKKITANLAAWNRRSLPPDPDEARALYLQWLNEQVKAAGLTDATIDPGKTSASAGAYVSIPVTVDCQATLPQLIDFLHRFYSADLLHKIRSIGIRPAEGTDRLRVLLAADALSLPTAPKSNALPKGDSGRLALGDLAAYQRAFARRGGKDERFDTPYGFFGTYVAPPAAPSGFSAKALEDDDKTELACKVELSWKKADTPGVRYDVYRATGGGADFVKLNPKPLDDARYKDEGVRVDVAYAYRVRAVDQFDRHGEPSATAQATPRPEPPVAPPLSAKASEDRVSLSWKKSERRGTVYELYRATGTDGHFVKLTSEPVSGDSFTDRDVKLDVKYSYRVRATDRHRRQSDYSSTADATPQRAPEPKPGFDPTQYAFVTAILEASGRPQVWIVARTVGETLKLFEGDEFKIGHLRGTVGRIGPRSVEIEIDGRRRPVALGKSIHEAFTGSGDGS